MLRIIISFLLIGWALPLTSLTYANCPDEFTPSAYNTSLALDNQNLAESIYRNVFSRDRRLAMQVGFSSGDLSAVVAQATTVDFLLPFILAGVGFALCFVAAACCCSFDRRCPPCESWRRNYVKQPYSDCELRTTLAAGVVFSTGILVGAIVVFSSFSTFRSDVKMVRCGMYYSLDAALNGDQPHSWGGFAQIQSQVMNTSSQLSAAATSINANLLNNDWILSGMQRLQDMNLALYTNNHLSTVSTPDPAATAAANTAGTPIPTITPLFIQSMLGPNSTAGTLVNDIDAGLRVTQNLSGQAFKTYTVAVNLANSAGNITANTNLNLQSISIASSYLANIQASVTTFNEQFLEVAIGMGLYAAEAVFALVLLSSLLSLLGMVAAHLFQLYGCRWLVHGGWAALGVGYFAVAALLLVLLAAGGISYAFCEYYGAIITSDAGFLSFVAASQTNSNFNKFFSYLDVCFFQDGNILKKFQLATEMKTVADVFAQSQTYLNMQTAGNSLYVDTSVAPTRILSWIDKVTSYTQGIPYDALSTDLTEANPYVALANLNKLTNRNGPGNTVCASDLWVFDATNCTSGASESLYVTGTASNGLLIPATGSLCIPLSTRISQSAPSIWTASDISQRYLSVRSCKTGSSVAYGDIQRYAESLTGYRDSRINLYKSLGQQLNDLLSVTNTYNSNLSDFTSKVSAFFSAVATLNNVVTNQINGLTISANCTVIADSMRFFYNMYCVNFLNHSVKIILSSLVVLVLSLGAVLVGSVFGLRYSRVEKQRQFTGQDEAEDLKEDAIEDSVSSNSEDTP